MITCAPASRAASAVPSVEPSSTTMTRAGAVVCPSTLRTVSPTDATSLYAGMMTVSWAAGGVAGALLWGRPDVLVLGPGESVGHCVTCREPA